MNSEIGYSMNEINYEKLHEQSMTRAKKIREESGRCPFQKIEDLRYCDFLMPKIPKEYCEHFQEKTIKKDEFDKSGNLNVRKYHLCSFQGKKPETNP